MKPIPFTKIINKEDISLLERRRALLEKKAAAVNRKLKEKYRLVDSGLRPPLGLTNEIIALSYEHLDVYKKLSVLNQKIFKMECPGVYSKVYSKWAGNLYAVK